MLYQWFCAGTLVSLYVALAALIIAASFTVSPWFGFLIVPVAFALAALSIKVHEELL